jgi:beta-lactamase regulating signal transducer with metallopeptidase domain
MLLSVFEKYLFLQSLGWGIGNSLWQAALLWLVYRCVTKLNKNLSAIVKHHFSLLLLFASFLWFIITVTQNDLLVEASGNEATSLSCLNISENFAASLQYISMAYLGLLFIHGFQLIKHFKGLHLLRNSHFIKAPVGIRIFTEQTALHIGIQKKVAIWLSEKVDVPSVIGFFKPVILLPVTALNNLSTAQAEAVILHELAHIKRNDYLVNLLQSVIELVLFFNPFARMLGNAARKERENCCDDWVLNYQYNVHDYASALLVLEQNRLQSVKLVLTATNGKKALLGRVKRLFVATPQINTNLFQKIKLVSASLVIITIIFFVLPVINKQTSSDQPLAVNTLTTLPLLATHQTTPANTYPETRTPAIVHNEPAKLTEPETKEEDKAIADPVEQPLEEIEDNRALVNEELLNNDQAIQDIAVQAADKGLEIANEILVKIEEEQSGLKDKNTYVLQLKNNNGNPEIKPLLLLNKKIRTLNEKLKAAVKIKADSLKTTVKVRMTS